MRTVMPILLAMGLVAGLVSISLAIKQLPSIADPPPDLGEVSSRTWLGQGVGAAWAFGVVLVLVIYVNKWFIRQKTVSVREAVFWYLVTIACSLPFIWFFVVLDWHNPFIYRVTCWVYVPIAIWAVPTVTFVWDCIAERQLSWQDYLARTVIEVGVVIPLWLFCWVYVSFFVLGGGWI